jgi:hypothetical protein
MVAEVDYLKEKRHPENFQTIDWKIIYENYIKPRRHDLKSIKMMRIEAK